MIYPQACRLGQARFADAKCSSRLFADAVRFCMCLYQGISTLQARFAMDSLFADAVRSYTNR